jgi:hypothetical protein
MSRLDTHLRKYREFKAAAEKVDFESAKVEMWFLSAYHLIEACAAKQRVHILKHQKVAQELRRSPAILGPATAAVATAFEYLDRDARAKFVYGASGATADLAKAQRSFETVESRCLEVLR